MFWAKFMDNITADLKILETGWLDEYLDGVNFTTFDFYIHSHGMRYGNNNYYSALNFLFEWYLE